MIFRLAKQLGFPDPRLGEEDGLLAIGGDLSIDRLLLAYSNGIFPWYSFRDSDILWFCPMRRFVIFPNEIHVSHSMRNLMNKGLYDVTFNNDFPAVIEQCGKLRYDQEGAWLGEDMTKAYIALHDQGFAQSVEVWDEEGRLVGGLYGVTLGKCFFGESMFSLVPSASKLALIALAELMKDHGGVMIDCQLETPHLKSMGGGSIPYEEYMKYVSME